MQQPQWKGSHPQRFSGGRIHLRPQNQLDAHLQPQYSTISTAGLKTFSVEPTKQMVHRSCMKIYPNQYKLSGKEVDLKGKKYLPFPQQKQRIRPQREHIPGGFQTIDEVKLKGVKTYDDFNQSRNLQYHVESSMQKKIRIYGLEPQRNNLPVKSMGDKPYKYPQYAANFYHDGGLIAGSTHKPRLHKGASDRKVSNVLTKPNWDIKVALEERQEEKKAINSVDDWEQTILKEANPNWNDPDTFFEREEAKKQKDPKKGGKK